MIKTKKYIETIISSGVTKGVQNLPEIFQEIEEFEKNAEIGRAAKKFLNKLKELKNESVMEGTQKIQCVEDLLQWAKEN